MTTSLRHTFTNLKSLTPGTCEYCGQDVDPANTFCSLTCEALNRRLESAQGLLLIRTLKLWRKHRGRKGSPGEGQITEAASLVDRFLKSDRVRREKAVAERRQKETQEKDS